ncbi:MAG: response regulator [Caldilineaceae bacterium]|nr:response regulator [Caldilineaceae bacterium]MBP8109098.1 response regulator [Caldilineaceae bacterium]MBP8124174.1 response regulator [Caldilineaceae bacterium]MBP9073330.1 response regulator [Caldilineaceae bacterium]
MPNPTILVVDDEATLRKLMQFHLRPHGYNVITAGNGVEALEVINSQIPALVIIDVMMPEMNGYELTRQLRKNPRTAHIPIILLTALSNVQEKVEGFQAGADDFLIKPAELPELLMRVEALLRRAAAAQPVAAPLAEARIYMILSANDPNQATNIALNLAGLTQSRQQTIVIELIPAFTNTAFRLGLEAKQTLDDLLSINASSIGKPQFDDALITHPSSRIKLLVTAQDGNAPKPLTQEHTRALVNMAQRSNAIVFFVTHPILGDALLPLYASAEAALMVSRNFQEDLVTAMVLSQQVQNRGLAPTRLGLLVEHSPTSHNPTLPDMSALVTRMRMSSAGAVPALGQALAVANTEKKLPIQVASNEDRAAYQIVADLFSEHTISWPLTPGRVAARSNDPSPNLPPSHPHTLATPGTADGEMKPMYTSPQPADPQSAPVTPPSFEPNAANRPQPVAPAPPPPDDSSVGGWFRRPTRRGDS